MSVSREPAPFGCQFENGNGCGIGSQKIWHDPAQGVTYAIGPVGGGLTKIGYTGNVRKRLYQLQTGLSVRLVVLWTQKSKWSLERHLQKALALYRIHGEWFDLGPNPVTVIEETLIAFPWPGKHPDPESCCFCRCDCGHAAFTHKRRADRWQECKGAHCNCSKHTVLDHDRDCRLAG